MNATPNIQNAIAAYLIATNSMHTFVPRSELDYQIVYPETDEGYPIRDKYMLQFIWIGKTKTYIQGGKQVDTGKPFVIADYYDGTSIKDKDKLLDKFITHTRKLVKSEMDYHQATIDQLNLYSF